MEGLAETKDVPTQFERRLSVMEKLRHELRELFGAAILVIDMTSLGAAKTQNALPPEERGDILVQTGHDINDIRRYLESETDFKIIKEGHGLVLTKSDIAFYLKLTEQVEKPKMSLGKLRVIMDYLESINMEATPYMRDVDAVTKSLLDGKPVPLVIDGLNGIRVSYDKSTDQLKVWFTKGFENPDEPIRKKVEQWIKENFAADK